MAGLGGYAGGVLDRVLTAAEKQNPAPFRLVAVGDPGIDSDALSHRRRGLEARGVLVLPDFLATLDQPDVDAVWLPVPIHLHRRFVESAFTAGKHVVCEKPLAGCVADVDAMIDARDQAERAGLVGFQDLFHPVTRSLKRELLDGILGDVEHVTVFGSWPRTDVYFNRAGWAGCRVLDGVAVNDSPANNAMAHFLMLGLFLLGDTEADAAQPVSVGAQAWRAAPIENYDTVDASFSFRNGTQLRLLLTHATKHLRDVQVVVRGTRGSLAWVRSADDEPLLPVDRVVDAPGDTWSRLILEVGAALAGDRSATPALATFENARRHAVAVEMITQASETATIDPSRITPTDLGDDRGVNAHVPGLLEAMITAARTGEPLNF